MTTKRETKQGLALFGRRPKVGGMQLHPLTAGRLSVLEERGNPLIGGMKKGDELAAERVYEVMMVAAMTGDELAELALEEEREWRVAVRKFSFGVSEEALEAFWELTEKEMEAIRKARAVPVKKTTPRRTKPATSRRGG